MRITIAKRCDYALAVPSTLGLRRGGKAASTTRRSVRRGGGRSKRSARIGIAVQATSDRNSLALVIWHGVQRRGVNGANRAGG